MSVSGTNTPAAAAGRGRVPFWLGLGACLLGVALVFVQLGMKRLFVPWYGPALATVGVGLLLVAVARRRSTPRVVALALVAAVAGFEWYALGSLLKLPDYQGPARPGRQLPPFRATLADGRPLTEADFQDGSGRVLIFFKGRG